MLLVSPKRILGFRSPCSKVYVIGCRWQLCLLTEVSTLAAENHYCITSQTVPALQNYLKHSYLTKSVSSTSWNFAVTSIVGKPISYFCRWRIVLSREGLTTSPPLDDDMVFEHSCSHHECLVLHCTVLSPVTFMGQHKGILASPPVHLWELHS